MAWKTRQIYTWKDLEGRVAPEVFRAPRTCGDLTGEWQEVHSRSIGYVLRKALGTPWADCLTLIAAVLTAQRRDVSTVTNVVQILHARFSFLFPLFELDSVRQWRVDQHLIPYVQGAVSSHTNLLSHMQHRHEGNTLESE